MEQDENGAMAFIKSKTYFEQFREKMYKAFDTDSRKHTHTHTHTVELLKLRFSGANMLLNHNHNILYQ